MTRPAPYNHRDSQPPYLHEPYKSTVLRAPLRPPVPIPQTLSEVTGPLSATSR